MTTVSHETGTADSSKTTATGASSLFSTEKPTTMTQETAESEATDKPSVTPGTDVTGTISTLTSTDEEGSGDLTPDMFTKDTSETTVSSLYSTEKPVVTTASPVSEATDKPSVTPGTDVTGTSSTLTSTDEEGSGDLTPDMFTKETSETTVSSLYSTEKPVVTAASLQTETADMTTAITAASSLSSTEKPVVTTASHETGTADMTATAITAASSLYSTEKPTTMTHETAESESTDKPSATSGTDVTGTSSTLTSTDEEGSGDLTPGLSMRAVTATPVSSLYSTVQTDQPQTTASPTRYTTPDGTVTRQTGKTTIIPLIDDGETSSVLTAAEEESSAGKTSEMLTQESSRTRGVSTVAQTLQPEGTSVSVIGSSQDASTDGTVSQSTEQPGKSTTRKHLEQQRHM
ncbi:uncharacterized protein [Osmerus mordax]|uniref:uncharacterized protein n=1 Tax=Osmerus mordax TaxID=8014 RepID=UPI00350F0F91